MPTSSFSWSGDVKSGEERVTCVLVAARVMMDPEKKESQGDLRKSDGAVIAHMAKKKAIGGVEVWSKGGGEERRSGGRRRIDKETSKNEDTDTDL